MHLSQGEGSALDREQIAPLLATLAHWRLSDDAKRITRRYRFADFRGAWEFAAAIAALAEAQQHHPDITFGWGYCEVVYFTHTINGLCENDFVMAAKTDDLYTGS